MISHAEEKKLRLADARCLRSVQKLVRELLGENPRWWDRAFDDYHSARRPWVWRGVQNDLFDRWLGAPQEDRERIQKTLSFLRAYEFLAACCQRAYHHPQRDELIELFSLVSPLEDWAASLLLDWMHDIDNLKVWVAAAEGYELWKKRYRISRELNAEPGFDSSLDFRHR